MKSVSLISKPCVDAETLVGLAAATCTKSEDAKKALRGAMSSGHESVLEHAYYTFYIEGVSRVLLAQLTRHRIASFSVESQRYVSQDGKPVYVPDSVIENPDAQEIYVGTALAASRAYKQLVKIGIPEEDARYVLPMGIETNLVLSMNARELRHFFSLRCCNRAQKEIRQLADNMLSIMKLEAPALFNDAGPNCVRGKCPEGSRSCGRPRC